MKIRANAMHMIYVAEVDSSIIVLFIVNVFLSILIIYLHINHIPLHFLILIIIVMIIIAIVCPPQASSSIVSGGSTTRCDWSFCRTISCWLPGTLKAI